MDKAGVRAAFVTAGLSRLLKDIDFLAKDSIRLYAKLAGEYDISMGASRIGGIPDVPPEFKWPERNEVPQSFIAQLYLDEVHPYDTNGALPSSGMLWFFYDAKQEAYGADPSDHGGWRVMFSDDYSELQRIATPTRLPAESQFKACSVSFASEVTLSQSPQLDIPDFDWTDDEVQKYETLLSTFPTPEGSWRCASPVVGESANSIRMICAWSANLLRMG